MKNNVKLNYIYNLAFQIFAMITPLITTPYVSRVLSPVGIGQYSFAASINTYFCLVAALGFSFYGQREIAKQQDNIEKQSVVFWEIVLCKIIIGIVVSCLCWISIILGAFRDYYCLMIILSVEIIGTSLNISFFFQGNERFGLIAVRDFVVRILGIVAILLFVKERSDVWIYALINATTTLISAVSLWLNIKKRLVKIDTHCLNIKRHIKPSFRLFIPTIAISIYTILDKTLIGVLISGTVENHLANGDVVIEKISDIENGMYAQSEKIIKMAMTVIASLGTVMMPRNSKELALGNEYNFNKNIEKAISFVFFIGTPMSAGIIAVSNNFSPWFFGPGYEKVPILMCIFAFMIIPAGLGNVLGQQYLIPKGEDTKYAISYIFCAIINFCLNLIFIPRFLSYGAAVASVLAEIAAPVLMFIFVRKSISCINIVKSAVKPGLSALIMATFVYSLSSTLSPSIINTFILVLIGVFIYVLCLFLLRYEVALNLVSKLKERFGNG